MDKGAWWAIVHGVSKSEYILAIKRSLFLPMKGQSHAIQYCFHFGNFVEHLKNYITNFPIYWKTSLKPHNQDRICSS